MLVQPADDATGTSTSPTLEVTVSDPEATNMTVTFYGRPVSTTPGPDFSFVFLPDPQNYATSYPAIYTDQTQWVVDNAASQNIVFVTTVGDMVNTSSSATEYTRADAAFDILDAAGVPYSVGPGNHDMYTPTLWPDYFGASRISGKSWYGGAYNDYNTYSLFSASGNDFILINLQYSPSSTILDWADALLKANPNRRAIVEQHNILNVDNSWNSQTSFTALKDNPNLFLMICGHMHTPSDGAAYRAELGDDGHAIHIVQGDYQEFPNGGDGYLRILRFSPADDTIYMTTYSPYLDASIATDPDQKNLTYDLAGSSAAFTLIGTVNNVASGSNASVVWSDLDPNTEYEWFAVSSDGSLATNSATWSFTTGAGTQTYSLPLVAGWNLVSFPLQPVNSAITSTLADITGKFSLVFVWDASGASSGAGNWLSYDPSKPPFLNTLSSLDARVGFWIYMTTADTLDVTGTPPTTTNIPLLTGAGGWNLVGYPSASAGTMPTILGSANFTLVQSYRAADTADPWKIYDIGMPPFLNDLTALTNGWGYWIYMTAPYSWDVTY